MNLNIVETTIRIAGSEIRFSNFFLHQKMNAHHRCHIWVDYDTFGDDAWMKDPVRVFKLIGESISITMTHKTSSESNVFSGLVSNISFDDYHGNNHILIEGVSQTIKLSGQPHMDSFANSTLEEIVKEAVNNSGNGAEIKTQPGYTHLINFQMQYEESCFDFLNRLSHLYGKCFYSPNGSDIYFGKAPLDDAVEINMIWK